MAQLHPHAGKTALVTGAATGIGRAYALRLAEDGADVIVADLNDASETAAEIEALGRRALALQGDVSDEASVAALKEAADVFGRVDILINNAGIYPFSAFAASSFAVWRKVMAVNADSVYLMMAAFLPAMKDAGWGRIINVSTGMFHGGKPFASAYIASKAAVIGISRSVASEVGDDGVTINVIAPGLVRTTGTSQGYHDEKGLFDMVAQQQSIKRTQMPDDLTGVASFLASDDARFITGQTLIVDGGSAHV